MPWILSWITFAVSAMLNFFEKLDCTNLINPLILVDVKKIIEYIYSIHINISLPRLSYDQQSLRLASVAHFPRLRPFIFV
jgi:hypothetical protein